MQNPERPKRKYERCEDCRRSHVLSRLNARKVKRTLKGSENRPVQFNQGDGWRVGYLISIGTYKAVIQPIGALRGICPQTLEVALADLKPEQCQSASMPTVEDYYRMTASKKVPVLVVQKTDYPLLTPEVRAVLEPAIVKRPANAVVAVQDVAVSVPHEQAKPKVGTAKHPPIDTAKVLELNAQGVKISAIVEAVRGQRAAGGCGNLVREILEKAGVYNRPSK